MKIQNSIAVALIASLVLSSCNNDEVRETPNGFKFRLIEKGDGRVAIPGDVVVMDLTILDDDDSVWYSSKNGDIPEMVKIREESMKSMELGLVETFRMVSKGDSIVLMMKADDFFPLVWKSPPPRFVDPESIFSAQVLCRDVLDSTAFRKFVKELEAATKDTMIEEEAPQASIPPAEQLELDKTIIEAYLRSKNMKAETLPSGLSYILKKKGTGENIKNGDFATMRYAGQNLDGREFDSGEYSYTVGNGEVIEGWDEIAKVMKEGTSLTVFIPSGLAYKAGGRPPVIMPNAILIFDMECISVRR